MKKNEVFKIVDLKKNEITLLGVKHLGVFGSCVRDTLTEKSDLDFLVEFIPERKTYDNFLMVSEILEESFQRKIDLFTIESLSPYIGPHILKEVEYVF